MAHSRLQAREGHQPAARVLLIHQFLQRLGAHRVDQWHPAHADNPRAVVLGPFEGRQHRMHAAEEDRACKIVDPRARAERLEIIALGLEPRLVDWLRGNRCAQGRLANIDDRRDRHADDDRLGQIERRRGQHGYEHSGQCVAQPGVPVEVDRLPLVHAPSGDEQHPAQGRQGNAPDQRCQCQGAQQQHQRVDDAREPCGSAALDRHAGARDRRRGRHPAKERHEHVAEPLGHQFLIAVKGLARHCGAHRAAEQALDGAEGRDRDRWQQQPVQIAPRDRRQRQAAIEQDGARDRADQRDLPAGQCGDHACQHDAHQRGRDGLEEARQHEHGGDHDCGQGHGAPVRGGRAAQVAPELGQGVLGRCGLHAKHVIQLAHGDDDRDAAGEACDHWRGDELDVAPQAEQPEQHQHEPRQHAGDPDARQPVLPRNGDQDRGHGPGGAGDLVGRAAQPADDQPGQDGCHQARRRVGARGHAEGQRQRQRHRTHRDARQQIAPEHGQVVARKLVPQDAHHRQPRPDTIHGLDGSRVTNRRQLPMSQRRACLSADYADYADFRLISCLAGSANGPEICAICG